MSAKVHPLLLPLALAPSLLPAQNPPRDVIPAAFRTVEGDTHSNFQFGGVGAARVQDIYDIEDLGPSFSGPRLIKRVKLRADNDKNTVAYLAKPRVYVAVSISTSTVTAETASKGFYLNHGSDRIMVFDGTLDLPAQASGLTGPRPFNIDFPFSPPAFFDLTPVRTGRKRPTSLILDFQVFNKMVSGKYELDIPLSCTFDPVPFGTQNPKTCVGSNNLPLTLMSNNNVVTGGAIVYTLKNAIPTRDVILALGIGPLGNPPEVQIGQTGCYVSFAPLIVRLGKADQTGQKLYKFEIPKDRRLVGTYIQAQAGADDPRANPQSIVTSRGLTSKICGRRGLAQAIHFSSASSATANHVIFGAANILEIY